MANYYIPLVASPPVGGSGGGGGSDLPAVTAADNGDVLTVVNGQWDKAAPSGGGGALVVNVTEVDGVKTCDKTAGEIYAAAQSGPVVFYFYYDETSGSANILLEAYASGDSYEFTLQEGGGTATYSANTADDYPTADGPK